MALTMDDHHARELTKAIFHLARGIERFHGHECDGHGSTSSPVTRHDLEQNAQNIMAKIDDLISASTTLSTASDGLSVKLDNLIAKVDAVVAALENTDLPPEGEAALTALKASATAAATAGDKVDAEVTKLDGILPTPAPEAPVGGVS